MSESVESVDTVELFTDGACKGNPGPGGWGALLVCKGVEKELWGGEANTTNNRMELLGVIVGLEALNRPCSVDVYTDSQYVVKAFNDHWVDGWLKRGWKSASKKPVKNVDMWKRLLDAMADHRVTYHWVRGHAGHPENERCDSLATAAADGEDLLIDTGFAS